MLSCFFARRDAVKEINTMEERLCGRVLCCHAFIVSLFCLNLALAGRWKEALKAIGLIDRVTKTSFCISESLLSVLCSSPIFSVCM